MWPMHYHRLGSLTHQHPGTGSLDEVDSQGIQQRLYLRPPNVCRGGCRPHPFQRSPMSPSHPTNNLHHPAIVDNEGGRIHPGRRDRRMDDSLSPVLRPRRGGVSTASGPFRIARFGRMSATPRGAPPSRYRPSTLPPSRRPGAIPRTPRQPRLTAVFVLVVIIVVLVVVIVAVLVVILVAASLVVVLVVLVAAALYEAFLRAGPLRSRRILIR